jgi:hypothetical protein
MKSTSPHLPRTSPDAAKASVQHVSKPYEQSADVERGGIRKRVTDAGVLNRDDFGHDEQAFREYQNARHEERSRQALEQKTRDRETAPLRETARLKTVHDIAQRTNRDVAEMSYWNEEVSWKADIVSVTTDRQMTAVLQSDKRLKPLLMQAASLWAFVSKKYPGLMEAELPPKGPVERTSTSIWSKIKSVFRVVDNNYIPQWDEVASMALKTCGSPTSREKLSVFLEEKIAVWKAKYLVRPEERVAA